MGYAMLNMRGFNDGEKIVIHNHDLDIVGLSLYSQGEHDIIIVETNTEIKQTTIDKNGNFDEYVGKVHVGLDYLIEFSNFKSCGNYVGFGKLLAIELNGTRYNYKLRCLPSRQMPSPTSDFYRHIESGDYSDNYCNYIRGYQQGVSDSTNGISILTQIGPMTLMSWTMDDSCYKHGYADGHLGAGIRAYVKVDDLSRKVQE